MIKMVSAPSSTALALLCRQYTQEIDPIQNFLNGIVYIVSRHKNLDQIDFWTVRLCLLPKYLRQIGWPNVGGSEPSAELFLVAFH